MAHAVARYERLSVITVPTEMDEGIATDRAAASTAHQAETRRRARRYTGTAVSAKHHAFATLNHSYAESTLPASRMIAASTTGRRGPKPKCSPRSVRPCPVASDDAAIV